MTRCLAIGLLATIATAPLASQTISDGRWSVLVERPTGIDHGDLRLQGDVGRLLLESNDTTWLVVHDLVRSTGQLTFRLPAGGLFVGAIDGDQITGLLHDPAGAPLRVEAHRIQPGTVHWPVRPRFIMRQLVVGSSAASSRFSDRWLDAIPGTDSVAAATAALADSVGLPEADALEAGQRSHAFATGSTPRARRRAVAILERIARGPAADQEFHRLFGAPGRWRIDIHQVAWQRARDRVGPGKLLPERIIPNLITAGVVDSGSIDSTNLQQVVWQIERRVHSRKQLGQATLLGGTDSRLLGLRAILDGYDDARTWWLEATRWLLTHDWLSGPGGWVSPAELVANFWHVDSLTLPELVLQDFGGVQAVPVSGVGPDWPGLLIPKNGVATEWLTGDGSRQQAFTAWRRLQLGRGIEMPLLLDSLTLSLGSPASAVASHLGGFIGAVDQIEIDPTIVPIFAVATVLHEWQHLQLNAARMKAPQHPGWRMHDWGVRWFEGDPWLVEGAAEWATEQVLSGAGQVGQLYRLIEAEKRLALGVRNPIDTHALGYTLVRAAADRAGSRELMRSLLVEHLSQPELLARSVGLGGPVSESIDRTSTLMVIPEIGFVVDGGVADQVSDRLFIPENFLEQN